MLYITVRISIGLEGQSSVDKMNVLWAIIWFLVLIFIAWPVGFFCAGWYVCCSPFEACISGCKVITEFLMKGLSFPLNVAQHMIEGKSSW